MLQLRADAMPSVASASENTRRRFATLALLAVVLNVGTAAPVEAMTMQEKTRIACAADIARLCPGTAEDPDRMKPCMLKHRSDASSACMRFIDASE